MLKIGNAQAFWGDSPTAPSELVSQCPDLDFLTLDYLAEVSMSILAIQRAKNPAEGFARDFLEVVKSLIPYWQQGHRVRVVANAGGLNPIACAEACRSILSVLPGMKIGVIDGDDVLTHFPDQQLATANVYLGARPIAQALDQGAQIVITGRTADPSLTVGPCLHHYKWSDTDWERLAGATIAGHLIECGTQVTGGFSTNWLDWPDHSNIGFPIAEVAEDGSCVITKPPGTGGVVNTQTVKEQLLYEIGDPSRYLSPDVTVSFLGLHVEEIGPDRVRVSGAIGSPPPTTYKVSATYSDGFRAEAFLTLIGRDLKRKALLCAERVWERVRRAGFELEQKHLECLGMGDAVPGVLPVGQGDFQEIVMRLAVADSREAAVKAFAKEIAPMITSGPQGITGYTSGRPTIRPIYGFRALTLPRSEVTPRVKILEVS